MMGYAERRADLAHGHEVDELRTGDIATRDEHGFFRIVGRAKRMSKIAGLRINHEAVEAALARQGIVATVLGDDERLRVAFATARRWRDESTPTLTPPHKGEGGLGGSAYVSPSPLWGGVRGGG
jgi:acyl-CoA synthetase (AMP-forming)/AMP-acid ligase II